MVEGGQGVGQEQLAEIVRVAMKLEGGARARVKGWLKWFGYRTGFVPAVARRWNGSRAFVIIYHKVEHRPRGPFGAHALDVPAFTAHVEYLARNYEIVPLSTLIAGLKKGQLPSRTVSLTFDDGYRNNLTLAFPILHRYRVPATVFVTAGLVGTNQWMWSSELAEMCLRYGLKTTGVVSGDSLLTCLMEAELPESMRIEAAVEYLLRLGPVWREALMARLRKRFEVLPDDENKFLNWDEVRALRAGGVEIGSHTMTHPVLTDLTDHQVEQELSASRNLIAEQIHETPTLFCYPHGSFSAQVKNVTRQYYGSAVSTIAGDNTPATDPWELRRVTAYSIDDLSFQLTRPW